MGAHGSQKLKGVPSLASGMLLVTCNNHQGASTEEQVELEKVLGPQLCEALTLQSLGPGGGGPGQWRV